MRDSPSERQASTETSTGDDCVTSRVMERERLVDDLAFLVVRQHQRHQRAAPDNDPAPTSIGVGSP
jgi:hypothetical protein